MSNQDKKEAMSGGRRWMPGMRPTIDVTPDQVYDNAVPLFKLWEKLIRSLVSVRAFFSTIITVSINSRKNRKREAEKRLAAHRRKIGEGSLANEIVKSEKEIGQEAIAARKAAYQLREQLHGPRVSRAQDMKIKEKANREIAQADHRSAQIEKGLAGKKQAKKRSRDHGPFM